VVNRSIANSKQVSLEVRMDMADISCPDDNGNHSLFHTSTEEMTRSDGYKPQISITEDLARVSKRELSY
jgi:hypothetical protein